MLQKFLCFCCILSGTNKLLLCITVELVHKIMRVVYSHCFAFQYACDTQCVASGGMFCHMQSVCQKRHDIMRSDGSTWEFYIFPVVRYSKECLACVLVRIGHS